MQERKDITAAGLLRSSNIKGKEIIEVVSQGTFNSTEKTSSEQSKVGQKYKGRKTEEQASRKRYRKLQTI